MRRFLIKTLQMLFLGLFLFLGTGWIIRFYLEDNVLSVNKIKTLFDHKILIIGDSHTQTALIPDSIPTSINISTSSENFYYTYNVLYTLINKYKTTLNNLILGVSVHSFSYNMDKTLFDSDLSKESLHKYISVINDNELSTVKRCDRVFATNYLAYKMCFWNLDEIQLLLKSSVGNIIPEDIPFCGFFYISNKSNLTSKAIDDAIGLHYNTGKLYSSDIQIKYLNKIVSLCETNNINLILLNTPLYKEYRDRIPNIFIELYYSEIQKYLNKEHIYFLDYSKYNLPDSCFGDGHHLNIRGAQFFSKEINNKLKEIGILGDIE